MEPSMIRIGFEILPTHRHGISDSQNKVDSNRYDRPDFIDAYEKRPDQPDGEEVDPPGETVWRLG